MPCGVVSAEYCAWPTESLDASLLQMCCTAARGVGSSNFNLSHVTYIEEAGSRPHRHMFVRDAGVLDGHVPASKGNHAGTE